MEKRGCRVGDWALALMGGQGRDGMGKRVFPFADADCFLCALVAGTGLQWASPALSGANEKGLKVQ